MNTDERATETALCFQIHPLDNVATMLDDGSGSVKILRAQGCADAVMPDELQLSEPVAQGHKVALQNIASGEAVLKFGVRIGHATQPIAGGAWVHLHNLASDLDTRSGTLDLHSGAPTDTASAYV
jgi:altronate dehydratase small subunit